MPSWESCVTQRIESSTPYSILECQPLVFAGHELVALDGYTRGTLIIISLQAERYKHTSHTNKGFKESKRVLNKVELHILVRYLRLILYFELYLF